jgi:hypothetical protein
VAREAWPKAIGNFVAACEATGARMVFIDNLYMAGPQTTPLVETMPLTSYGVKPAARSAATRIWMEAAAAGRARIAALRAPDFYGPNVGLAFLGDTSIGALAKGKSAFFIGSPDIPMGSRLATTSFEALCLRQRAPQDEDGRFPPGHTTLSPRCCSIGAKSRSSWSNE